MTFVYITRGHRPNKLVLYGHHAPRNHSFPINPLKADLLNVGLLIVGGKYYKGSVTTQRFSSLYGNASRMISKTVQTQTPLGPNYWLFYFTSMTVFESILSPA